MKNLFILSSILFSLGITPLFGQTPSEEIQRIKKINTLAENISAVKRQISETKNKADLDKLNTKLKNLEATFDDMATDSDLFTSEEDEDNTTSDQDVWKELQEVLRPVVQSLKRASERPRKIEQLRNDIADLEEKIADAKHGMSSINDLINKPEASKIKEQLKASHARTTHMAQNMMLEVNMLKDQLKEELKNDKSLWYTSKELFADFFKTKGVNLIYAIFTALLVFGVLLLLKRSILRPIFSTERLYLVGRPVLALYGVLSVVLSIAAGLICLFLLNDWFLFIIILLAIAAVLWGFKHLVENLIGAIRFVFDLGTVREGQRIIYNGCPWLVKRIGLRTMLVNEVLQGGEINVNIGKMKELTSRPLVKDEPWFPTKHSDYVLLADGTYGKVVVQTPDQVVLVLLGGTKKYYTVADFLANKPQNISEGFEIMTSISVDYSIQNKIHDTVKLFRTGMLLRIRDHKLSSKIQRKGIEIQFEEAAESSLNIFVGIKFKGIMAPYYFELKREINAMLVDICNEKKLSIPYKQLVVHVSR